MVLVGEIIISGLIHMMEVITKLNEFWQSWSNSNWMWIGKYSYSYDEHFNLELKLWQVWDDSTWVNGNIYFYTYDGSNKLIEKLFQIWNDSIFVNTEKESYSYDVNYNKLELLHQNWNGSEWINFDKYSYSYIPITSINENLSSVNSYSLSNNYPNPFNPTTNIQYSISRRQFVSLKVYDILGIEIETLVNEEKSAGNYELNWNAANLPSGVYFYRLQAGDFVQTRKMTLLK